jgi:acetyl-CoA carboxylase beta subunit
VYALIFYAFLRALSRNIETRRKENTWFKAKANRIRKKREIYNQRKADIFHIYKKCPACKAVLRLPHRIGVHKTVCPRCSKEFTVKVKK